MARSGVRRRRSRSGLIVASSLVAIGFAVAVAALPARTIVLLALLGLIAIVVIISVFSTSTPQG